MDENNKEFGLTEYMAQEGRLLIRTPRFNLDTFPALAERLLKLLSAQVVEKWKNSGMATCTAGWSILKRHICS